MSTLEISIAFQTNKFPARYRELAQLVNRYPFARVSAYNDLSFQPALGPLLLMAADVKRSCFDLWVTNKWSVRKRVRRSNVIERSMAIEEAVWKEGIFQSMKQRCILV